MVDGCLSAEDIYSEEFILFYCPLDCDPNSNETDLDGIIRSYGYTANVPINAKVRLQQSMDLAKRFVVGWIHPFPLSRKLMTIIWCITFL
jgi:hypothetical protein